MAYAVRITKKAELDIAEAFAWYAKQAPHAARRWLDGLYESIETLSHFPLRCPLMTDMADSGHEWRQLLHGKKHGQYRIVFEIEGKTVYVIAVRHAARDSITH